MKFLTRITTIFLISMLLGCYKERYEPGIKTMFLNGKDRDALRKLALPELYKLYAETSGKYPGYEVISKKYGRFILNYVPQFNLLTVCTDPGSGWGKQFKNVDGVLLEMLARDSITLQQLQTIGSTGTRYDTLLVKNDIFYPVQTNGSPNL